MPDFQKMWVDTDGEPVLQRSQVLFVSHNMAAVESLCSRCIWIEAGRLRADGEARGIVAEYMRTFAQSSAGTVALEQIETRTGNGEGRFTHMSFLNAAGETTNYIRSGDKLTLRLHYRAFTELRDVVIGINIHNEYGTLLAASNNWATGDDIPIVAGRRRLC